MGLWLCLRLLIPPCGPPACPPACPPAPCLQDMRAIILKDWGSVAATWDYCSGGKLQLDSSGSVFLDGARASCCRCCCRCRCCCCCPEATAQLIENAVPNRPTAALPLPPHHLQWMWAARTGWFKRHTPVPTARQGRMRDRHSNTWTQHSGVWSGSGRVARSMSDADPFLRPSLLRWLSLAPAASMFLARPPGQNHGP